MPTIQQKLDVLDFYEKMKAEKAAAQSALLAPKPVGVSRKELNDYHKKKREAKKKLRRNLQKLCAAEFPHILGKAQVCKWVAAAKAEAWREIPEQIRARSVATTNSWRSKLGLKAKGKQLGGIVPLPLQKELDLLMLESCAGLSDVTERKEVVTNEAVVTWQPHACTRCAVYILGAMLTRNPAEAKTLADLIDDWNRTLDERCEVVKAANAEVGRKYKEGLLLPEAAIEALQPLPERLQYPSESWVRWWKSSWGWSMLQRSADDQQYLPYGHQDMAMARKLVKDMFEVEDPPVHRYLLLNYDQVWRSCYSNSKYKLCYKDRSGAGQRARKKAIPRRLDKKLHTVKGSRASLTASWFE